MTRVRCSVRMEAATGLAQQTPAPGTDQRSRTSPPPPNCRRAVSTQGVLSFYASAPRRLADAASASQHTVFWSQIPSDLEEEDAAAEDVAAEDAADPPGTGTLSPEHTWPKMGASYLATMRPRNDDDTRALLDQEKEALCFCSFTRE